MPKLYTKTGDLGKTSLFDGVRVLKNHERVQAYGQIDELNSILGVLLAQTPCVKEWKEVIEKIQKELFNLGGHLATQAEVGRKKLPPLLESWIKNLEEHIDEKTKKLPPLKNFILPGGSVTGSYFHLARTVCRRAERSCLFIQNSDASLKFIIKYLNRLSDFLFICARYSNFLEQKKERVWSR